MRFKLVSYVDLLILDYQDYLPPGTTGEIDTSCSVAVKRISVHRVNVLIRAEGQLKVQGHVLTAGKLIHVRLVWDTSGPKGYVV